MLGVTLEDVRVCSSPSRRSYERLGSVSAANNLAVGPRLCHRGGGNRGGTRRRRRLNCSCSAATRSIPPRRSLYARARPDEARATGFPDCFQAGRQLRVPVGYRSSESPRCTAESARPAVNLAYRRTDLLIQLQGSAVERLRKSLNRRRQCRRAGNDLLTRGCVGWRCAPAGKRS